MNKAKNYSRSFALALPILLLLTLLPAAVFTQENGPYEPMANDEVTLADSPLEFYAVIQRKMINGSNQYATWTPVIRGRILGQTHRGDEVMVALSQYGRLIHILHVGLKGTVGGTWYEDWEIRGDDNGVLMAVGTITATFKYYNNRDERTTTLGVRRFRVVLVDDAANTVWGVGALSRTTNNGRSFER